MSRKQMRPLKDRFMEKIFRSESGCWEWRASRNKRGYGRILIAKRVHLAHRVSFELFRAPIPEGMSVCHRCDNPSCVNPEHLFVGTHKENMADCRRKGRARAPLGSENHVSKLSPDLVRYIRSSSKSNCELSREIGVSDVAIRSARIGKSWAWVDCEERSEKPAELMEREVAA